ncbi:hypothetical protein JD844_001049 [Phrynosoma platyrhinos]|uniref:Ig-like domain-containing protein n=1 Tax=Phrynosoma platyrhinos TaxID=52577 RepID=A0ABQ7T9K2_PHRPL|nr:hypothetical protein JD844_001049 [Phrynosoma platyrhinos]
MSSFTIMKSLLFLYFLVVLPKGVFLDVQLTSSGPGMLRPGGTLNLLCRVKGFSISTRYYDWNWIRQPPGKGLEWVAQIYPYSGGKGYAPSLMSRSTISSDTSKNEFSLQLSSVTLEDSAVYFCVRRDTCNTFTGEAKISKADGMLGVLLAEITLIQSADKEMKPEQTLSLTCTISGLPIATEHMYWQWFQQLIGKAPKWMGWIYPLSGAKYTDEALQGRIVLSADKSKNEVYLQLSSLTFEDSAMYYCTRDTQ